MAVPHIFAGSASGTTVQFDANFDYFARAIVTDSSGNIAFGSSAPLSKVHVQGDTDSVADLSQGLRISNESFTAGTLAGMLFTTADTLNGYIAAVRRAGFDGRLSFAVNSGGSSSSLVEVLRLDADAVYLPSIGTTASAANAFIDAGATNKVLRSTSSLRYKTDVRDLPESYRAAVMALRPVVYKSNAEADDPALDHVGLIAEEVAEHAPRLVHYTRLTEGGALVPDGVQYDRLAVVLLAEVQALRARVAALEAA